MVKKFLVSSSLIATLVSSGFSQDVYSYISIGSNENFNAGANIALKNDRYISASFKNIDNNKIYNLYLNKIFSEKSEDDNNIDTSTIGMGFLCNDVKGKRKYKPSINSSYAFNNYEVKSYISDFNNFGISLNKRIYYFTKRENSLATFKKDTKKYEGILSIGISYDEIQKISENSIFLSFGILFF